MSDLDRFLKAQESDYQTALKEIKNGKKVSCWMWYIFPQIRGLGMTQMANHYGIKNIEEAIDYLKHEILRKRLVEISQALLDLDEEEDDIREIMGFPDDLKLRSSMTLFKKAAELSNIDCDNVFEKVLERYYKGEDDNRTLTILEKQKYEKEKEKEKEKAIKNNNIDNKSSDEEKERSGESNEGKKEDKEDNKNNNNINDINNDNANKDDINENRIQHLDSIATLSEESIEQPDEGNNEQDNNDTNENNKNNIVNSNIDNNNVKKETIDELLQKSEKINNEENNNDIKAKVNNDEKEIISEVNNDRIPNNKNNEQNNDEDESKCSFCPNINMCNIM